MTTHVVDMIDRALVDETLVDAMRWTPALPPALACFFCGTAMIPATVDVTRLGDTKPREMLTVRCPVPH